MAVNRIIARPRLRGWQRRRTAGCGAARGEGAPAQEVLPALHGLFGPQTMVVTMINGVPWWYFQRQPGSVREARAGQRRSGRCDRRADRTRADHRQRRLPRRRAGRAGQGRVIEGNRFTLGELDGRRSPRIEGLHKALMSAGFKAPIARDIRPEIWLKLWGSLSFNPVSALTHATLEGSAALRWPRAGRGDDARGEGRSREARHRFRVSIEKRIAGAEAVGAHKTSMLQNVEQGRALELQALVGSVVELGRITGAPTPSIEVVHTAPPCSRGPWRRAAPAWRSPAEPSRRGRRPSPALLLARISLGLDPDTDCPPSP